jgi:CIC family chloride channel protein
MAPGWPSRYTILRVVGLPVRVFVRQLRALFTGNENALFFTAVCLVGLLGGIAGAGFRWILGLAARGFWGGDEQIVLAALEAGWHQRLLIPVAGGALAAAVGMLLAGRRVPRGGFPEIMELVALGGRMIRLSSALRRSLSSLMTLASGGAVGREGPMSQIAAAIGSRVGRSFRFPEDRIRILVAAGMAAGFAAAYNTPISATVFVLEVIIGSFNVLFLGPAVVAAAISTIVTRFVAGAGPIYPGVSGGMESPWEVPPYLALGFLAGLAAVLFQFALERMYRIWDRARLPDLVRTPLGGLCLGILALGWPWVLGNGYETINMVLAGQLVIGLLAILFFAKILATTITLASGGSGGVFTPTMFLGAMLGGVFGGVLHVAFPDQIGAAPAYALAGMGGLVAGTTHAPFLAILLIFELTQSYEVVLPVMLTSVAAYSTARAIRRTSIYEEELRRRGMRWEGSPQERLMRSLVVRDIMVGEIPLYPENLPFDRIVEIFQGSRYLQIYIGDSDDRLLGIVELHEVKRILGEEEYAPLLIAADLVTDIPVVTPGDSLVEVNEKLWLRDLGHLPVVDTDENRRFLGIVTRRDVLGAFDREILKRSALLAKVRAFEGAGFDYLELPAETQMAKVVVPPGMVGKSLRETRLREERGINVLAIERLDSTGQRQRVAPAGETVLQRGDVMVVIGAEEQVEQLRS